jgi:tRNA A37 threonylcarbamoyladenosine synthetase subunit TsaC/SUA5/YrdC
MKIVRFPIETVRGIVEKFEHEDTVNRVCKYRRSEMNRNRATENAANVLLAIEENKIVILQTI